MSLTFLLPAALAALAALILPLAIHLARRDQTRPIDFAALRWLRPKPRPRQRVRFDEWPLLAARLLLVAALAVFLARPALLGRADDTPWLAVVPGVDPAPVAASAANARWLAPGFPTLDQAPPAGPVPVASLLRQLDAELPPQVRLSIVVPEQLEGADAQRPQLSRPVEWRVTPGAMLVPRPAPEAVPGLTVRYAPGRESALRYLRAAAVAWQPPGRPADFDAASAAAELPAARRHLVWLAPGPLPQAVRRWLEAGGTALLAHDTAFDSPMTVLWRDDLGATLVEGGAAGQGRILRFTRPFAPATMPQLLQPEFPQHLRALLTPPENEPARVDARDYAPRTGGPAYPQPAEDLRPWLALLIAALWLAERALATRRRRGVAP